MNITEVEVVELAARRHDDHDRIEPGGTCGVDDMLDDWSAVESGQQLSAAEP
jgi:hypothetical protein